jgi:hypothetical protein
MSDKKIWKVEKADSYVHYDEFETLEKAQDYARSKAWSNGEDFWILGPVGLAKAPVEVNTVHVEKIT